MPIFNVVECPVCGGHDFQPFLVCTDFFVSGEEFAIKKCTGCGFKITDAVEDEEQIGRYYQSEEYVSHSDTTKGIVNKIYHRVRKIMLRRKRILVEKSTQAKRGRLLDVGTGTGYFLHTMKERGWQVAGTEKSSEARELVHNEFGIEVFPPENLFSFGNDAFDAITLWHVLEHVHRLNENMEAFFRLLKKSGKLIIALPNHASFDALHYKKHWAAWDVPRHIWHFTPRQMKMLAQKHGFRLIAIHTMPFDSFYVSILSERYKNSKAALLKGIFYGKVSWLQSLLKPGTCSSVIYVLEKNY